MPFAEVAFRCAPMKPVKATFVHSKHFTQNVKLA
jgi:hypothetical protein